MNGPIRDHPTEEELHDFADAALPAERRADVALHLGECAECTAAVTRVRAVFAGVAALPRCVEPGEDLWPGIEERIQRDARPRAGTGRTRFLMSRSLSRGRAGWLAAAAVLLVVASSAITALVIRRGSPTQSVQAPVTAAGVGQGDASRVTPVSDDYDRMERDLTALLESQRKVLQPETVAKVERNLEIIDRAIAEIRQALAADPTNRALHGLLRASYGQKAALLQQASRT